MLNLPTAHSSLQLCLNPLELGSRPSAGDNTEPGLVARAQLRSGPVGFRGDNHEHNLSRARARHRHADDSRVALQLRRRLEVLLATAMRPPSRGWLAGRAVPQGSGSHRPAGSVLLVGDVRSLPQLAASAEPRGDGNQEGGPPHQDEGRHSLGQRLRGGLYCGQSLRGTDGKPLGHRWNGVLQDAYLDELDPDEASDDGRDGIAGERPERHAEQAIARTAEDGPQPRLVMSRGSWWRPLLAYRGITTAMVTT